MKWNVIYADPAWQYNSRKTGGSMKSGADQHYPTMSTAAICDLPVQAITARDAVCFLWGTVPMLPDAFQVLEAWGFDYRTMITWHKTGRLGLGYWFRGATEHLLLGVRGSVRPFRLAIPNLIAAPVGRHSEKPQQFRELIERATRDMADPRRLEMFARYQAPGWAAWGHDLTGSANLTEFALYHGFQALKEEQPA